MEILWSTPGGSSYQLPQLPLRIATDEVRCRRSLVRDLEFRRLNNVLLTKTIWACFTVL